MASFVYNEGANQLLGGSINWATDTIKARLIPTSITPNKDDAVMTGMTVVGTDQVLASKTKTKDTTNDRIVYDAADPNWTAVATGATVNGAIVYKDTGSDATAVPICFVDITDTPTNGGDIGITFDANGIFYLQQ
jgi:hypothetical protein